MRACIRAQRTRLSASVSRNDGRKRAEVLGLDRRCTAAHIVQRTRYYCGAVVLYLLNERKLTEFFFSAADCRTQSTGILIGPRPYRMSGSRPLRNLSAAFKVIVVAVGKGSNVLYRILFFIRYSNSLFIGSVFFFLLKRAHKKPIHIYII